jgi:DNA-binding IclR family transcriptional regulator
VRDGRGRAAGAVVVAAPTSRARGRALDRLSSPLLATAAAISQNLGP